MMPIPKFNNIKKGPLDLLLILVLMCAFTGFALMIVSIGAGAYDNVIKNVENNSQLRLPLTFISNKIHQGDEANSISIVDKEETKVLVIRSSNNNISYENWIFVYEGSLRELLVQSGDTFNLSDGIKVMELEKLEMNMKSNDLIQVTSYNSQGESLELVINLRSM